MSRARDMANLGVQAGSGFDASDLTTGTLGNTVQDNITRLGTVTSGTFNGTVGTSAIFPSGHLLKVSTVYLSSDIDYSSGTSYQDIFDTADHVCDGGASNNTTIYPFLDFSCYWGNNTSSDARKNIRVTYSGATHSPTVSAKSFTVGAVLNYGTADRELQDLITIPLPVVTISASGTLSIKVEIQNVNSNGRFVVYGDNSTESRVRFMEVQ